MMITRLGNQLTLVVGVLLLLTACSRTEVSPTDKRAEAFDDIRTEMQVLIIDADRQAQALQHVDDLEQIFTDAQKKTEQHRADLRALNYDYDATEEQFATLLKDTDTFASGIQQQVSTIRANMADLLTAEEWLAISKSRSQALDAALTALQPS